MSDNENKGLFLTIKIIIGILIAMVAVIIGFVVIIANSIRKAGDEIKNENERDIYNITVRVDDVVVDPDDSMYDIEHVTITYVEEKAENSNYAPHVGDTLVLHHYLMHTTPDEVGDSIDLKIKDGEIVNVFAKWYETYKRKTNTSTSTDAS
jgi:flagellar basal body-associated protein FliL